jgi:23S rRNA A2030 N6-methylase RlmJ
MKGKAVVPAQLYVEVEYQVHPAEEATEYAGETEIIRVWLGDRIVTEELEQDDIDEIRESLNLQLAEARRRESV